MLRSPALHRSPRLPASEYVGPLVAHVVIVTGGRQPILEGATADIALSKLQATVSRFETEMHAYCLMPDHAHLLVGVPEGISLQDLVRHFKQTSGFALKQHLGFEPWQVSYYDPILRSEESISDVAEYIWHNPVEAGLASTHNEYALCGPREVMV